VNLYILNPSARRVKLWSPVAQVATRPHFRRIGAAVPG